jgi:hypothetical protein
LGGHGGRGRGGPGGRRLRPHPAVPSPARPLATRDPGSDAATGSLGSAGSPAEARRTSPVKSPGRNEASAPDPRLINPSPLLRARSRGPHPN